MATPIFKPTRSRPSLNRDMNNGVIQIFQKASVLPNPDGPLSAGVPSSAIAEANRKVQPLLIEAGSTSKKTGKRGVY